MIKWSNRWPKGDIFEGCCVSHKTRKANIYSQQMQIIFIYGKFIGFTQSLDHLRREMTTKKHEDNLEMKV